MSSSTSQEQRSSSQQGGAPAAASTPTSEMRTSTQQGPYNYPHPEGENLPMAAYRKVFSEDHTGTLISAISTTTGGGGSTERVSSTTACDNISPPSGMIIHATSNKEHRSFRGLYSEHRSDVEHGRKSSTSMTSMKPDSTTSEIVGGTYRDDETRNRISSMSSHPRQQLVQPPTAANTSSLLKPSTPGGDGCRSDGSGTASTVAATHDIMGRMQGTSLVGRSIQGAAPAASGSSSSQENYYKNADGFNIQQQFRTPNLSHVDEHQNFATQTNGQHLHPQLAQLQGFDQNGGLAFTPNNNRRVVTDQRQQMSQNNSRTTPNSSGKISIGATTGGLQEQQQYQHNKLSVHATPVSNSNNVSPGSCTSPSDHHQQFAPQLNEISERTATKNSKETHRIINSRLVRSQSENLTDHDVGRRRHFFDTSNKGVALVHDQGEHQSRNKQMMQSDGRSPGPASSSHAGGGENYEMMTLLQQNAGGASSSFSPSSPGVAAGNKNISMATYEYNNQQAGASTSSPYFGTTISQMPVSQNKTKIFNREYKVGDSFSSSGATLEEHYVATSQYPELQTHSGSIAVGAQQQPGGQQQLQKSQQLFQQQQQQTSSQQFSSSHQHQHQVVRQTTDEVSHQMNLHEQTTTIQRMMSLETTTRQVQRFGQMADVMIPSQGQHQQQQTTGAGNVQFLNNTVNNPSGSATGPAGSSSAHSGSGSPGDFVVTTTQGQEAPATALGATSAYPLNLPSPLLALQQQANSIAAATTLAAQQNMNSAASPTSAQSQTQDVRNAQLALNSVISDLQNVMAAASYALGNAERAAQKLHENELNQPSESEFAQLADIRVQCSNGVDEKEMLNDRPVQLQLQDYIGGVPYDPQFLQEQTAQQEHTAVMNTTSGIITNTGSPGLMLQDSQQQLQQTAVAQQVGHQQQQIPAQARPSPRNHVENQPGLATTPVAAASRSRSERSRAAAATPMNVITPTVMTNPNLDCFTPVDFRVELERQRSGEHQHQARAVKTAATEDEHLQQQPVVMNQTLLSDHLPLDQHTGGHMRFLGEKETLLPKVDEEVVDQHQNPRQRTPFVEVIIGPRPDLSPGGTDSSTDKTSKESSGSSSSGSNNGSSKQGGTSSDSSKNLADLRSLSHIAGTSGTSSAGRAPNNDTQQHPKKIKGVLKKKHRSADSARGQDKSGRPVPSSPELDSYPERQRSTVSFHPMVSAEGSEEKLPLNYTDSNDGSRSPNNFRMSANSISDYKSDETSSNSQVNSEDALRPSATNTTSSENRSDGNRSDDTFTLRQKEEERVERERDQDLTNTGSGPGETHSVVPDLLSSVDDELLLSSRQQDRETMRRRILEKNRNSNTHALVAGAKKHIQQNGATTIMSKGSSAGAGASNKNRGFVVSPHRSSPAPPQDINTSEEPTSNETPDSISVKGTYASSDTTPNTSPTEEKDEQSSDKLSTGRGRSESSSTGGANDETVSKSTSRDNVSSNSKTVKSSTNKSSNSSSNLLNNEDPTSSNAWRTTSADTKPDTGTSKKKCNKQDHIIEDERAEILRDEGPSGATVEQKEEDVLDHDSPSRQRCDTDRITTARALEREIFKDKNLSKPNTSVVKASTVGEKLVEDEGKDLPAGETDMKDSSAKRTFSSPNVMFTAETSVNPQIGEQGSFAHRISAPVSYRSGQQHGAPSSKDKERNAGPVSCGPSEQTRTTGTGATRHGGSEADSSETNASTTNMMTFGNKRIPALGGAPSEGDDDSGTLMNREHGNMIPPLSPQSHSYPRTSVDSRDYNLKNPMSETSIRSLQTTAFNQKINAGSQPQNQPSISFQQQSINRMQANISAGDASSSTEIGGAAALLPTQHNRMLDDTSAGIVGKLELDEQDSAFNTLLPTANSNASVSRAASSAVPLPPSFSRDNSRDNTQQRSASRGFSGGANTTANRAAVTNRSNNRSGNISGHAITRGSNNANDEASAYDFELEDEPMKKNLRRTQSSLRSISGLSNQSDESQGSHSNSASRNFYARTHSGSAHQDHHPVLRPQNIAQNKQPAVSPSATSNANSSAEEVLSARGAANVNFSDPDWMPPNKAGQVQVLNQQGVHQPSRPRATNGTSRTSHSSATQASYVPSPYVVTQTPGVDGRQSEGTFDVRLRPNGPDSIRTSNTTSTSRYSLPSTGELNDMLQGSSNILRRNDPTDTSYSGQVNLVNNYIQQQQQLNNAANTSGRTTVASSKAGSNLDQQHHQGLSPAVSQMMGMGPNLNTQLNATPLNKHSSVSPPAAYSKAQVSAENFFATSKAATQSLTPTAAKKAGALTLQTDAFQVPEGAATRGLGREYFASMNDRSCDLDLVMKEYFRTRELKTRPKKVEDGSYVPTNGISSGDINYMRGKWAAPRAMTDRKEVVVTTAASEEQQDVDKEGGKEMGANHADKERTSTSETVHNKDHESLDYSPVSAEALHTFNQQRQLKVQQLDSKAREISLLITEIERWILNQQRASGLFDGTLGGSFLYPNEDELNSMDGERVSEIMREQSYELMSMTNMNDSNFHDIRKLCKLFVQLLKFDLEEVLEDIGVLSAVPVNKGGSLMLFDKPILHGVAEEDQTADIKAAAGHDQSDEHPPGSRDSNETDHRRDSGADGRSSPLSSKNHSLHLNCKAEDKPLTFREWLVPGREWEGKICIPGDFRTTQDDSGVDYYLAIEAQPWRVPPYPPLKDLPPPLIYAIHSDGSDAQFVRIKTAKLKDMRQFDGDEKPIFTDIENAQYYGRVLDGGELLDTPISREHSGNNDGNDHDVSATGTAGRNSKSKPTGSSRSSSKNNGRGDRDAGEMNAKITTMPRDYLFNQQRLIDTLPRISQESVSNYEYEIEEEDDEQEPYEKLDFLDLEWEDFETRIEGKLCLKTGKISGTCLQLMDSGEDGFYYPVTDSTKNTFELFPVLHNNYWLQDPQGYPIGRDRSSNFLESQTETNSSSLTQRASMATEEQYTGEDNNNNEDHDQEIRKSRTRAFSFVPKSRRDGSSRGEDPSITTTTPAQLQTYSPIGESHPGEHLRLSDRSDYSELADCHVLKSVKTSRKRKIARTTLLREIVDSYARYHEEFGEAPDLPNSIPVDIWVRLYEASFLFPKILQNDFRDLELCLKAKQFQNREDLRKFLKSLAGHGPVSKTRLLAHNRWSQSRSRLQQIFMRLAAVQQANKIWSRQLWTDEATRVRTEDMRLRKLFENIDAQLRNLPTRVCLAELESMRVVKEQQGEDEEEVEQPNRGAKTSSEAMLKKQKTASSQIFCRKPHQSGTYDYLWSNCVICMCALEGEDDQQDGDVVRLPCKHYFHFDCALEWLNNKGTCPTCRKPAMKPVIV
ncbi:unnamed protein product [Amoebophrya sp. A120]|nr:unnamed protein product [Amoebophrya sp. A120]|eukprot:GSA120T00024154001.1